MLFEKNYQNQKTYNKNNIISRRELGKLGWRRSAALASPRIRGFLKTDERRSGDSFVAVNLWNGREPEASRCALTVPAKSVDINALCSAYAFCVRLFPNEANLIVRRPRTPVCRSLEDMRFYTPQASQQDVLRESSHPTSREGKINDHIVAESYALLNRHTVTSFSPMVLNVVYRTSPLGLKKNYGIFA